ncbi:MAG: isoprenylcysteine carboxylmethyltransferase family protein, partial [Bacteroidota bacterium]
LFFMVALWSPKYDPFYDLHGTIWAWVLLGLFGVGAGIIAYTGLLMGGKELMGISALTAISSGKAAAPDTFRTPGLYKYVRHPLYLGMLICFWVTPAMTRDHLFFSEVMTAYILIGIYFEEKDLEKRFGDAYHDYKKRVPMLIPWKGRP